MVTEKMEIFAPAELTDVDPPTERMPVLLELDPPTQRIDTNRRSSRRVMTSLRAIVASGRRFVPFEIDNLSATGARLSGELVLLLGQRLAITFCLDGVAVGVTGEVVRVQTEDLITDQVAVRFVDPTPEAVSRIEAFVESVLG